MAARRLLRGRINAALGVLPVDMHCAMPAAREAAAKVRKEVSDAEADLAKYQVIQSAIDRAMFDERFTPDSPNATPEELAANESNREAARRDRARVMLLAGHYAPVEEGGAPREPVDRDAVMAPGFVPNADEVADMYGTLTPAPMTSWDTVTAIRREWEGPLVRVSGAS